MDTQTITKTSQKLRNAFGKIENINLEINTETVSDIYFAFEHFFPEGTVYKSDEPYQRGKFYWNNKQEFIEYVDEKTGIKIDGSDKKLIKKAEEIFFDIAEGKNIKVDSEMKGAPDSPVESNKMTEEQNKEWQEKDKLNTEKAQKVREQSDKEVREAIVQKQKLAQEQKTTVTQTQPVDDFYSTSAMPPIYNLPEDTVEEVENKEIKKEVKHAYKPIDVPQKFPTDPRLKDFVVTVVPKNGDESLPTTTLTPEYITTLTEYHQKATNNPEALYEEIKEKITNSIPTEEKAYVPAEEINRQAQKFVEISKELPKKIPEQIVLMNGFSAFTALTDERNPVLKELIPDKTDLKKVVESAQIMAHVGALEQDVSINLTSSFLPPKLQQIYYGYTDTIEFVPVVGTDQKNEGINLNIERIVDEAQEFKEIIQNAPKGEVDESSVGFLGRQPVYIPTTETDLETKEKGSEELPWYKNSKHHTQADMYKRLHKELPIMVDATTPSGKIISGNIINSTFIPSKKGFINTEDVEYTIVQDNQFIPEVTNENGEQIKFDSFNDYSNYLSDARNFGKDYIPRIKFSDGKTLSFNSISEYATYVENLNTSSSSLTSFFQKNKIPILTTAAIGAYSVNNLQLMNYIAQEHGGQMIMYLGVGKNSFSVINTANYVLGGVKKEVYQAGFEFGSKSLKLAITKSGGKITSNALKIGTGTGKIVSKALPGVLSKAITWVAGLSSWATAGLSLAVGWIAGKVIEKIPWEKVKKWGSAILGGIAGLIALPFFGIGGFIGAFAGVTLISTAFGGGLGGYSVASGIGTAVGGIANVAKIAMATALAGIAGPILFILLGFPVIVALILFIINSGAYVVPPSPLSSALSSSDVIVSPYIDVVKTANPAGPFQNNQLPLTVEYTITITAKKGQLSGVQIKYECNVTKKSGSTSCPPVTPAIPTTLPNGVSPTKSESFTYKQTYTAPNFIDSLVADTLTVSATTADGQNAVAAASLGIKIGNPPDQCPNGWPIGGSHVITQTPGGSYSHQSVEAIDFAAPIGTPVRATHSGIAHVIKTTGAYRPVYVTISSVCGGKSFQSWYAHLSAVSITDGQQVTMGQLLGATGTAGSGPHLHYEFRGLTMGVPYIPKSIPRNCSSDTGACGSIP